MQDTADVLAETLISGLRHPLESPGEFRHRAHREPARLPDTSLFPRLAHPDTQAEAASRAEPPWAEHEAEP
jgi:hypothetical protein